MAEHAERVRARRAAAAGNTPGVVLVGHHVLIREGLENLARETGAFRLLRAFHDVDCVHADDFSLDAELLLLCASCNEARFNDPGKMVRELRLAFPRAQLLIINGTFDEEQTCRLVRLGVRGFLPPDAGRETIRRAFQALLRGEMWISRVLSNRLLAELLVDAAEDVYEKPGAMFSLSRREVEILQALASGLSNLQIAEKLFLSEKTVKTHVHHIFSKMEVGTRTQAVLKALKHHLL